MEVREINSPAELNNFIAANWGGQFLQSWDWGDFQISQNHQVWRLGIYEQNDLLASAQVILHPLPFSHAYLYIPHGPVFKNNLSFLQKEKIVKLFLSKARDITIATNKKSEIFLRLEPRLSAVELGNFFFNLGLKKTSAVQPQDTQIIDLTKTSEEILAQMHPKTRYNIRLAKKHGVIVKDAETKKDFVNFINLLRETARRDGFKIHSDKYYQTMWEMFHNTDIADQNSLTIKLFLAEYNQQVLAGGLFSFFGDRVVYLHGASTTLHKEVMAPYLLHWELMELAKKYGYYQYDLYGVKPTQRIINKNDRENNWDGITRFKKGFGGKEVNYLGAWDWIYDKIWYGIYKLAKSFYD